MHNHSDKIQPKKVAITVVLAILLFGFGWYFTKDKEVTREVGDKDKISVTNNQPEVISYTITEVATHNLEADCWMVIEGKVYDVTKFIPGHPGGKAILNGCGKDATALFNERPTNNRGPHPAQARATLNPYYIGELKP